MKALSRVLLSVGLIGLCASESVGEDGVIEINQARVMAGGVTEDDMPGFPVTISESGSYRLTGNLDLRIAAAPQDTTAIAVVGPAKHVSVDLNGFAILGSTRCGEPPFMCSPVGSGVGIEADDGIFARVSNGVVRGMGASGVRIRSGTVFDVHASHNGECGICVISSPGIVSGCTASSNGTDGIGVLNGVVRGNTARDNARAGILVRAGSVLVDNTAGGNLIGGIGATEALLGSLAIGNSTHANGGTGIGLSARSGFADNVSSNNVGVQIFGGIELDPNVCNGTTPCR